MFTEGIFVSFLVMIQYLAFLVDAQILHVHNREELWAVACQVYLVHLWKLTAGKKDRFCCWHDSCTEQNVFVVTPCNGSFVGASGGKPFGFATEFVHYEDIQATFTTRCESNLLAVWTPNGVGIVCCIRGKLSCLTARSGYGEHVSFVRKRNGLPIGRD